MLGFIGRRLATWHTQSARCVIPLGRQISQSRWTYNNCARGAGRWRCPNDGRSTKSRQPRFRQARSSREVASRGRPGQLPLAGRRRTASAIKITIRAPTAPRRRTPRSRIWPGQKLALPLPTQGLAARASEASRDRRRLEPGSMKPKDVREELPCHETVG